MSIESLKQELDTAYEGSIFDDGDDCGISYMPVVLKDADEFDSIHQNSDGVKRHHNIGKKVANGQKLKGGKRLEYAFCTNISIGDLIDVYSYVSREYTTLRIIKIVEKKPSGFMVVAE
jgi:hypothetical protein